MPAYDVEELEIVWRSTIVAIKKGAGLKKRGGRVTNALPKESQSRIAHVRPHANRAAYKFEDGTIIGDINKDANPLPNGQWMTNQCFWFNKSYLREIINRAKRM